MIELSLTEINRAIVADFAKIFYEEKDGLSFIYWGVILNCAKYI